jgi:hypothetical protein
MPVSSFALALLFATRVGGLGIAMTVPDGWEVVHPDPLPVEVGTPIAKLQRGEAALHVTRAALPAGIDVKTKAGVERALREWSGDEVRLVTVAGEQGAEVKRDEGVQVVLVHGQSLYAVSLVDGGDSPDARSGLDALVRSIHWSDAPIRVEGGGVSLLIPPDWQLRAAQGEGEAKDPVLLHVGHDETVNGFGVSMQMIRNPLPEDVKDPEAVDFGRTLAAGTAALTGMKIVEQPHKITLGGVPAAAWSMSLADKEEDGTPVTYRLRSLLFIRGSSYYYSIFTAPDDDKEDAAAYDAIVKSMTVK